MAESGVNPHPQCSFHYPQTGGPLRFEQSCLITVIPKDLRPESCGGKEQHPLSSFVRFLLHRHLCLKKSAFSGFSKLKLILIYFDLRKPTADLIYNTAIRKMMDTFLGLAELQLTFV